MSKTIQRTGGRLSLGGIIHRYEEGIDFEESTGLLHAAAAMTETAVFLDHPENWSDLIDFLIRVGSETDVAPRVNKTYEPDPELRVLARKLLASYVMRKGVGPITPNNQAKLVKFYASDAAHGKIDGHKLDRIRSLIEHFWERAAGSWDKLLRHGIASEFSTEYDALKKAEEALINIGDFAFLAEKQAYPQVPRLFHLLRSEAGNWGTSIAEKRRAAFEKIGDIQWDLSALQTLHGGWVAPERVARLQWLLTHRDEIDRDCQLILAACSVAQIFGTNLPKLVDALIKLITDFQWWRMHHLD